MTTVQRLRDEAIATGMEMAGRDFDGLMGRIRVLKNTLIGSPESKREWKALYRAVQDLQRHEADFERRRKEAQGSKSPTMRQFIRVEGVALAMARKLIEGRYKRLLAEGKK